MEDTPRKPTKAQEQETRRRFHSRSNVSTNSSPEFEFWMTRNPSSIPQPDQLLSADELFLDGVLLPLHLLHNHHHQPNLSTSSSQLPLPLEKDTPLTADNTTTSSLLGGSKRWKDILFKKTLALVQNDERVKDEDGDKDKDKKKKGKKNGREKKKKGGVTGLVSGSGSGAAELNIINIWPFSRSRSAGNGSTRPKMVPPGSTRKVSSAPCSRSNSSGENKSGRKWPSSPGRVNGGVYLGRSSPVWQIRPNGSGPRARNSSNYSEPLLQVRSGEKEGHSKNEFSVPKQDKIGATSDNGTSGASNKAKILKLNVPKCIGYRSHHLNCRSDVNSAPIVNSGGEMRGKNGDNEGDCGPIASGSDGGNLFNFRSLFTRKVY